MAVWLTKLAKQIDRMRLENANDQKVIVLDIDGTILDIRYSAYHLFRQYDQTHGTDFFQNLNLTHLRTSGNSITSILKNGVYRVSFNGRL